MCLYCGTDTYLSRAGTGHMHDTALAVVVRVATISKCSRAQVGIFGVKEVLFAPAAQSVKALSRDHQAGSGHVVYSVHAIGVQVRQSGQSKRSPSWQKPFEATVLEQCHQRPGKAALAVLKAAVGILHLRPDDIGISSAFEEVCQSADNAGRYLRICVEKQ